jgi:hypothetical protein
MAPILGIWASAQQNAFSTAYDSIATVTVGAGGSSSITFSSIPSTYTNLQIRYNARTDRSGSAEDNIQLRFNSDSGNNYTTNVFYGDGSTAGSFSDGTNVTFNTRGMVSASAATSNIFGAGIYDIFNYGNTSINKTVKCLSGYDQSGSAQVRLSSGIWFNTAAITSITIVSANNANMVQNSSFALYGIKGA